MIVLLAEGRTEKVLGVHLKAFLDRRADIEGKPKVALRTKDIMNLNPRKLRGRIRLELREPQVDGVVGLVDVYPDFPSAQAARDFLLEAADGDPRFHAHAAQYDVEAWLLPYWDTICRRLGVRRAAPGHDPEAVDRERPPSRRLAELYRLARPRRKYVKTAEMSAILRNQDLTVSADRCPEFKALLNTLLTVAGLSPLG